MSAPGQPMNMQNEAAAALASRPPGNAPQGQPPAQGGGDMGSLAAFAQAFARCEQTHACTPQDRAILEAGLPKLVQMAKMTQQILQASGGAGGQPPQPQGQQPQPAPQPGQ